MSLILEKSTLAEQIEALKEDRDNGRLGDREFRRQVGPLTRQLLGDREYEHARKRKRKERARRAEIEDARALRRARRAEKVASGEATEIGCAA